ncbi:MAG: hypothetical protein JW894_04510 [Bacteroidales bacterium]|nr:hypothetical protein [Bacteroidales bacterium]
MNKLVLGIFTSTIAFAYSCEKNNEVISERKIALKTDKNSYCINENLVFTINNNLDSSAYYLVCSGYQKPIPGIEKINNDIWFTERAPICEGFMTYCCNELNKSESVSDVISLNNLSTGRYRLKIIFFVRNSENHYIDYETVSNEFTIE